MRISDWSSEVCSSICPVRGVKRSKHLSYSVCHHPTLNATLSGSLLLYSSELLSKQEWWLSWANPAQIPLRRSLSVTAKHAETCRSWVFPVCSHRRIGP